MPYIKKRKETLCWSCEKACGACQWSSNAKPIPNWDAEETFIRNESASSYASYLVKSCPEYQATIDYYESETELLEIIAHRTGYSAYSTQAHKKAALKAFQKYQEFYPRSEWHPEEQRNYYLTLCYEAELKKEKIRKKEEKLKKILKKG